MIPAAVQSVSHGDALTVFRRHAPGEKATVDYVVEQRITGLGVSILIGMVFYRGKGLVFLCSWIK